MKRNTFLISAAVVGLSALLATATFAHGPNGGGYGQGFMNGQGQHGMMNGQGARMQGGPGQNYMQGKGFGDCQNGARTLDTPLTIEDVRTNLTQHLKMRGNDRLKVGDITENDTGTITAKIVTVDDSLVRTIEIDKATGQRTPVK